MSDPAINTYHASIQDDLLSPPRSKMLKDKFLPRILKPDRRKKSKSKSIFKFVISIFV
jgi:hypothetical protein